MNIVFINRRYYPEAEAGPAFSVQSLAEELVEMGHACAVICIAASPESSDGTHRGVAIYRFDSQLSKQQIGEATQQLLYRINPEIVHTNWLLGFPLDQLGELTKSVDARLVHSLREYRFLCGHGTLFRAGKGPCTKICADCGRDRELAKRFALEVDVVVGVSQFCLDLHLQHGLFKNADYNVVIHNGYSPPAFPVAAPSAKQQGRMQLGYLGRINEEKGILWLLKQLSRSKLASEINLNIAGSVTQNIAQQLSQASPELSINWLGFSEPEDLFSQVDWLIVPSIWHEPMGRSIIEAFAHGVPVLAARMGGIPELIEHGRNGRLFSPANKGELEQELRWILDNRESWQGFRQQAWQNRKRFLPDKIAQQFMTVYSAQ